MAETKAKDAEGDHMNEDNPWSSDCEILANGIGGEEGKRLTVLVNTAGAQAKAGNLTAAAESLESVRRMLVGRDYFRHYDNDIWVFRDIIMSIRHQSSETQVPPTYQRFIDAGPPLKMDEDMTRTQKAFWYGSPDVPVGGEIRVVSLQQNGAEQPPVSKKSNSITGAVATAAGGADTTPRSTFGKPWPLVVGAALLSLVLIAWGAGWLFEEGSWVGCIPLVGGLLIAYFAVSARTANCPVCKEKLSFLNVLSGYPRCVKCDKYYQVVGRELVTVKAGVTSRVPVFCVPLKGLKSPSAWVWPDPQLCCVCGLPATRRMELTVPHLALWKIGIPYCGKCSGGVQIGMDPAGNTSSAEQSIKFASYDLYLAFRELNMPRHNG